MGAGFPDCPAFREVGDAAAVQNLTRLRMRLDLQAGEHVTAVLVYDHEWRAGHLATLENALGASFAARRSGPNPCPPTWRPSATMGSTRTTKT